MQASDVTHRLRELSRGAENRARIVDPTAVGGQEIQRQLRSEGVFLDELADAIDDICEALTAPPSDSDYKADVAQAFGRVRG